MLRLDGHEILVDIYSVFLPMEERSDNGITAINCVRCQSIKSKAQEINNKA